MGNTLLRWIWEGILSCNNVPEGNVQFDTNLSWVDAIMLTFTILVGSVLIAHILPCCKCHEKCKSSEYPGLSLETYTNIIRLHGVNPKAQKSKKDRRTVDILLLKRDLVFGKLAWHGDYWKDLYCYLRLEHPLLSLFYGHPLHAFNRHERRCAFIGVQFIAVGIAVILTYITAELFYACNLENANEGLKWLVGFTFDLLFGVIVSTVGNWYYLAATCECAQNCNDCCRKLVNKLGHLAMLMVFGGSVVMCFTINILFYLFQLDNFDRSSQNSIVIVFGINYLTGLFLSWFLIDLLSMWAAFNREWKVQMGIKRPFCDGCCCGLFTRLCRCSRCCIAAWCCCCCGCYYLCCDFAGSAVSFDSKDDEEEEETDQEEDDDGKNKKKKKKKNKKKKKKKPRIRKRHYPTDGNGEIIGSYKGEFGVTWQDYVNYSQNKKLKKRNLKLLIEKTMRGREIETLESTLLFQLDTNEEAIDDDNDNDGDVNQELELQVAVEDNTAGNTEVNSAAASDDNKDNNDNNVQDDDEDDANDKNVIKNEDDERNNENVNDANEDDSNGKNEKTKEKDIEIDVNKLGDPPELNSVPTESIQKEDGNGNE